MAKGIQLKDKDGNKVYAAPYFPIGSIYMSINKVNPSVYFGGEWEQLYGGYIYAAQTSIGKTDFAGWNTQSGGGGTSGAYSGTSGAYSGTSGAYSGTSGSTAITVDQMPSHTHTQNSHKHHGFRYNDSSSSADTCVVSTTYNGSGCIELGWSRSSTGYPYDNVSTKAATATNKNTGGGKGHTHSIPSHTHSIPSHTHSIPSHTHSTPNHTHNIATVDVFVWKRIK